MAREMALQPSYIPLVLCNMECQECGNISDLNLTTAPWTNRGHYHCTNFCGAELDAWGGEVPSG